MDIDDDAVPPDGAPLREITLVLRGRLLRVARGRARGGTPVHISYRADQSLGHEAEALGIPEPEIGAATADGSPWPLELPAPDGAEVELFPVQEPLACRDEPAFVVDVHLGHLARDLRLLGFDVAWRNDFSGDELVELSMVDGRILLTRDRSLLYRRGLRRSEAGVGMLILSASHEEQLLEACLRFGLGGKMRPFSLCSVCGARLVRAEGQGLAGLVPQAVAERYDEFFSCPSCGKVYWKGDHLRNIEPFLERLGARLGEGLAGGPSFPPTSGIP